MLRSFLSIPVISAFFLLLLPAHSASLDAPAEATIGSIIEVDWEGPGKNYDLIYLVKKGAGDDGKALFKQSILSKKTPLPLSMAEEPGDYEIRYMTMADKSIIARRPITLVDIPTSIEAPAEAKIGETIQITWKGPGNQYDRVDLFPDGAAADAKPLSGASITSRKNPLSLRLPVEAGTYELRYRTARSKRMLAIRPLQIGDVSASLEAPENIGIGAQLEVKWSGPGNDYDRINLYLADSADEAKGVTGAAILSKKNPVTFRVPEQAGKFELRYVTAQGNRILARRPIQIGSTETALDAPERATASTQILVKWSGPGNNYDQIALLPGGAAADAKPLATAAILSGKNPVPLKLPEQEGSFELQYRTAQTGTVLAKRPILIEPAGRLAVVFELEGELPNSEPQNSGTGAIELILDASGSMLQKVDGKRRIEIAREVLIKMVSENLPDDQAFALRVFGHKEADKCRSDLEIPLGKFDRDAVAKRIAGINAMNLAKTPIADSLAQIPKDLAGAKGPKNVVLITDGEETCGGDPAAVITDLRASGIDIQVSIVGFAIDDPELKTSFEDWAALGGGSYFDASSAEELTRSLRTVISGPFQVLDSDGKVVAKGVIGGAPVVLPAGSYRVETIGGKVRTIDEVEIKPRELTKASF